MLPVPARRFRIVAFLGLAVVAPLSAAAQATSGTGFAPGARTIVDLNFAGTPVGQFPQGLRPLPGAKLEVVTKDGVQMLRASSPSEFVLPLPEALPKNFTLEIELIPKACCNPVDLAVEGVISGSRSAVSAQLEWDVDHFMIVGGNPEPFQMDMPAAIGASLPSTLTTVALSFEDETVKMYTNGQRVYTLNGRKFVRGRVLRIYLGGTDNDQQAVYLARVRVADAATTIASSQSASTGTGLATTLNGATLSTVGGGTVPVSTSAPTATSAGTPTNPGTTAGPLPAGTVAPTPGQTAATQPAPLSSPTNPLPTVTSGATAQQQNPALAQPRGSTGTSATATAPLAGTTGPLSSTGSAATTTLLAGPIGIATGEWSATANGWGVVITWTPVSGAASYRISRTVTASGIAGAPVPVISLPSGWFGGSGNLFAVDRTVEPSTDYTYWVEGVMVSGVLTNPSPVSTVRTGMAPAVMNLRATVGGTTQVALPGSFGAGGPVSGSNVTFAWDPLPFAFAYEISYQIIGRTGQERKTLLTTVALPPTIAPITFGVPQGASVQFCVSVWGSSIPAKSLPLSATCLTTSVP